MGIMVETFVWIQIDKVDSASLDRYIGLGRGETLKRISPCKFTYPFCLS